eukprot:TRINITY_DN26656_c0_g1_i1.p1 TRINITY_DN26656_c0_g1~~TRINITY_DN26656_c0_g1_i1.p1  ORF type:complete len:415 (+),score=34.15 TRINITY_DN26656_c0_g1_i1:103-1347(+)
MPSSAVPRRASRRVASWAPNLVASRPRCPLQAMADFSKESLEKRTIDDLIKMREMSHQERCLQLHETLKVGLARTAMRLSEMPLGFCNQPSIRRVAHTYVQNFRALSEFEHKYGVTGVSGNDYQDVTRAIFNQHRGTMLDVAKGVFEFYEDLEQIFDDGRELADLRDELPLINDIESQLDEFFTTRLTLRLLISHVRDLNGGKSLEPPNKTPAADMVGVVNVNTQPIEILSRAFSAARFMCLRDYKVAPELLVNGISHHDYLAAKFGKTQQHFAYVHTQLFYILLELIKNAARASVESAQAQQSPEAKGKIDIPPIRVIVPEDQALWNQERSIKLEDRGTGMGRHVLSKAFCYFYSSVKDRPTVAQEVSDFDRKGPLAGFGFGLPISRVMARYFSGDVDLNSIPGRGTDVYVYL